MGEGRGESRKSRSFKGLRSAKGGERDSRSLRNTRLKVLTKKLTLTCPVAGWNAKVEAAVVAAAAQRTMRAYAVVAVAHVADGEGAWHPRDERHVTLEPAPRPLEGRHVRLLCVAAVAGRNEALQ